MWSKQIPFKLTFFVALYIYSTFHVEASSASVKSAAMVKSAAVVKCSSVLNLSSKTYEVFGEKTLLDTYVDLNSQFVNKNIETALTELVLLSREEAQVLSLNLKNEPDSTDGFKFREMLSLGLYEKSSWAKLIKSEFRTKIFGADFWWNRGFLFTQMPLELLSFVKQTLNDLMKQAGNLAEAKRVSRVISFLNVLLNKPEIGLQKSIDLRQDLNIILGDYFQFGGAQLSHYKEGSLIDSKGSVLNKCC